MKWTKKYPTKEGWYWYSDGLTDYEPIALFVTGRGEEFETTSHCEITTYWKKGDKEEGDGRWSDEPISQFPPKRKIPKD